MNFQEAIKALSEGKKVRAIGWKPHEYVYLKNGKVYGEEGEQVTITISPGDSFSVVEEPEERLFQWVHRGPCRSFRVHPYLLTEKQASETFALEYKKLDDVLGVK